MSRSVRGAIVLAVGTTVEVLQFLGVPIFGQTFDPLDFAMYVLGVVGAVVLEWGLLSRLDARGDSTGAPTRRQRAS